MTEAEVNRIATEVYRLSLDGEQRVYAALDALDLLEEAKRKVLKKCDRRLVGWIYFLLRGQRLFDCMRRAQVYLVDEHLGGFCGNNFYRLPADKRLS